MLMVRICFKGRILADRGDTLIEQVATLRADHAALGQRVTGIETQVSGLRADLADKHQQNRTSIHELRNMSQGVLDEVHKLALSMTAFISAAKAEGGVKSKVINWGFSIIGGGIVIYVGKMIEKAMH